MKQRKKEILAIAEAMFRAKGYDSAGMREIAKACNLEPASLYSHFSSKQEMLVKICFDLAERFDVSIHEINDIYFNAEERLRMVIKSHIEILTQNLNKAVVFLRDWRYLEGTYLQEFKSLRDNYEKGIISIVSNGVYEERFSETDAKFAALTILSSVNWIVEWYNPEGKLSPEQVANRLSNFILTGLLKNQYTYQSN